jgi:hypothetical protein
MPDYRLYCIGSEGHFVRCEEFVADGDEQAIALSQSMRGGYAAELWSGKRRVKAFERPGAEV